MIWYKPIYGQSTKAYSPQSADSVTQPALSASRLAAASAINPFYSVDLSLISVCIKRLPQTRTSCLAHRWKDHHCYKKKRTKSNSDSKHAAGRVCFKAFISHIYSCLKWIKNKNWNKTLRFGFQPGSRLTVKSDYLTSLALSVRQGS